MFYDQEQAYSKLETPFDLFFTLTCLLHFYSDAFFALLTGLIVDLAWVATTITTRLIEWAVESLCDAISEGALAIRCRLHRERPAEEVAGSRVPALVLCLLFVAFDLLSDWSTLGWSFFVRFPLPVLLGFVLVIAIEGWLIIRLSALHCGAWETTQLLAEVEQSRMRKCAPRSSRPIGKSNNAPVEEKSNWPRLPTGPPRPKSRALRMTTAWPLVGGSPW